MTLLPHILALAVGSLPLWLLWPRAAASRQQGGGFRLDGRDPHEALLILCLGFPLGAGMLGLGYFGLLNAGVDKVWGAVGVAVLPSGLAWIFRTRAAQEPMPEEPAAEEQMAAVAEPAGQPVAAFPGNWMLGLAAAVGVVAVCAAIAGMLEKSPYGAWDSWAIWSVRGKFLAAGTEFWRNAVDPGFRMSHPEYPVLLSSYLGWGWRLVGLESPGIPQGTAFAYLLSLAGMAGAGVAMLRRASLGLMAIPVLLSPIVMVTVPASLYADLPMGVVSLAGGLLLLLGASGAGSLRLFAIAGVFASYCAWMKEEGLLHLLVLALTAAGMSASFRAKLAGWWRPGLAFFLGALPLGLSLWWFRVAFAPSTATRFAENATRQGGSGGSSMVSRALDLSRYGEIAEQMWAMVATLGDFLTHPLLLLLAVGLLLGCRREVLRGRTVVGATALLALLWGGYLASFVLLGGRPGPILAASLHRIWLHTWPLLVVAVFLAVNAPEEHAPVSGPASGGAGKGKKGRSR